MRNTFNPLVGHFSIRMDRNVIVDCLLHEDNQGRPLRTTFGSLGGLFGILRMVALGNQRVRGRVTLYACAWQMQNSLNSQISLKKPFFSLLTGF